MQPSTFHLTEAMQFANHHHDTKQGLSLYGFREVISPTQTT